jgi:hypothetical protein
LNTREFVIFDGRRAHEVEAFKGERVSLIFFTAERWHMSEGMYLDLLRDLGFPIPDLQMMNKMQASLPVPAGYGQNHLSYLTKVGRRIATKMVSQSAKPSSASSWRQPLQGSTWGLASLPKCSFSEIIDNSLNMCLAFRVPTSI